MVVIHEHAGVEAASFNPVKRRQIRDPRFFDPTLPELVLIAQPFVFGSDMFPTNELRPCSIRLEGEVLGELTQVRVMPPSRRLPCRSPLGAHMPQRGISPPHLPVDGPRPDERFRITLPTDHEPLEPGRAEDQRL